VASLELDRKIKEAVRSWRENRYEGVSDVTKRLLEYWFLEEHLLEDGTLFNFWRCQREAIESLIYAYEICKYQSLYELARGFGVSLLFDPTKDLWAKYCFKMATGSGKTFVMAFALVWQYFNKIYGTDNNVRYGSHFLLLAPNLIVLDRLSESFKDNAIFRDFPFVPKEWQGDFDLQIILQSSPEEPHSRGVLHLTNIQQLYERKEEGDENPIEELLGPKPKREEVIIYEHLLRRLMDYDDLVVMNDEAHHVHSDDLEWNKAIAKIHEGIKNKKNQGLIMQLDFSATPKDLNGNLFPHIIYDYPLAEAIIDKIVKRPRIGEIENIPEPITKDFVRKHQVQIDTGVEILKEFQKEFDGTDKKPVLFIMTDNTKNADKVGKYLEGRGLNDKVLVIHTDTAGVITKKDLEKAREVARKIDSPDNPYEAIVSVMMLKEGWDVRNVCIIVPLRAYDSPVLPEQTLGRGLRRMFPQDFGFEERVIVIDHPRFRQLWQAEIDKGELIADFTSAKKAYEPSNRIFVDPGKMEFDIAIPILEGGIQRKLPDLDKLDPSKLPGRFFVFKDIEIPKMMYREKDLLEQKIVRRKELSFDYVDSGDLYLSFITKAVLASVGASALFAELLPKVKDYIEKYLFDQAIDLEDKETVKRLNWIPVREKILEVFTEEINNLWKVEEIPYRISYFYKASGTPLLHTSEPLYKARKTVFNALPYPKRSEFEKEFMMYLDDQDEVISFTKILSRFPLRIPYYYDGYIRYYVPDFIVRTKGSFYLIETKGMEEVELPMKMKAAHAWCEAVSQVTGSEWSYVKVSREDLYKYGNIRFRDLVSYIV